MNLKYSTLNEVVRLLPVDITAKTKVVAAGIAYAISLRLPVPTEPNVNVDNYYDMNILALGNDPVSSFNEQIVFDTAQACQFVRLFWNLRYATLHPQRQLNYAALSQYGFFDTIMGVNIYVDSDTHEFVNDNKVAIYSVATEALRILNEGE